MHCDCVIMPVKCTSGLPSAMLYMLSHRLPNFPVKSHKFVFVSEQNIYFMNTCSLVAFAWRLLPHFIVFFKAMFHSATTVLNSAAAFFFSLHIIKHPHGDSHMYHVLLADSLSSFGI
uniref:Uncharacterized protein n=1 Tax=Zea mays TaxID=4577 RepID=C0HEZ7_MAIZE|nr:unknown [Zea mays]